MTRGGGVADRRRSRVLGGELIDDSDQERVAEALDALRRDILSERDRRRTRRFGFFASRESESRRGIYLWGGPGRGKTMLMDAFADALDSEFDDVLPADDFMSDSRRRFGVRSHFRVFMRDVREAARRAREDVVGDPIPSVAEAILASGTVLCLDELEIEDVADAMISGRLLRSLLERGARPVVTSNSPPDDLYRDGLNRNLFVPFIDMIASRLDVIEMSSATDYRRLRMSSAPRWSVGGSEGLDRAWRGLVGAERESSAVLNLSAGRRWRIERVAAGAARLEFDELCDRPRGASDYLALAERFRVVAIDGVPIFDDARRVSAKRFATLIDVLYDRGTALLVSAAAFPSCLCPVPLRDVPFDRIASRLDEMRSDDWPPSPRSGEN